MIILLIVYSKPALKILSFLEGVEKNRIVITGGNCAAALVQEIGSALKNAPIIDEQEA
ncbi:hypothetical protein QCA50_007737 [Cerrena zonata]|uniref:Uncharacterized protein n=1 Tax=Cerrena zonata TaxID=2478898 RepID=A0AAW0G6S6_9APHY